MHSRGTQHTSCAVEDVTLTVERGTVHAIVGESGGGKSLLAHAVACALPRNAEQVGTVYYEGRPLTIPVARKHVGLVPQNITYLDPLMRVGEQLRSIGGHTQMLNAVGLAPQYARAYPHELSGGQARRVLIAMGMVRDTDLLIADEPTPGLHSELSHEIMSLLCSTVSSQRALLVITHDLALALQYADVVTVIQAGSSIGTYPPAEFSNGSGYARRLWNALPQNGMDGVCSE